MGNGHDLVRRTLEGDIEAYNELVEATYPMVLSNCRDILFDEPDLVEDAAQNFFIKLPELLEKFNFTSKASTFIYTASRLETLNFKRVSKSGFNRNYEVCSTEAVEACCLPDKFQHPEKVEAVDVILSRITSFVTSLHSSMSEPFLLYMEGYKHKEIARELDIPERQSIKKVYEVNQLLRKEFKSDYLRLFKDLK